MKYILFALFLVTSMQIQAQGGDQQPLNDDNATVTSEQLQAQAQVDAQLKAQYADPNSQASKDWQKTVKSVLNSTDTSASKTPIVLDGHPATDDALLENAQNVPSVVNTTKQTPPAYVAPDRRPVKQETPYTKEEADRIAAGLTSLLARDKAADEARAAEDARQAQAKKDEEIRNVAYERDENIFLTYPYRTRLYLALESAGLTKGNPQPVLNAIGGDLKIEQQRLDLMKYMGALIKYDPHQTFTIDPYYKEVIKTLTKMTAELNKNNMIPSLGTLFFEMLKLRKEFSLLTDNTPTYGDDFNHLITYKMMPLKNFVRAILEALTSGEKSTINQIMAQIHNKFAELANGPEYKKLKNAMKFISTNQ